MKNRLMSLICCVVLSLQFGCVSKTQFDQALNSQKENNQIEKQSLVEQIERLNQTIQEKETIISVQETVIRLFDDSEQTLQNSIQNQLAAQKLEKSR